MENELTSLEKTLTNSISTDVPSEILNKFSKLSRVSGSDDEIQAFNYLKDYLEKWQVPYIDHQPEIYLSIPREAKLKITAPLVKEIFAKTPSFSISTNEEWIDKELCYIHLGYGRNNIVSKRPPLVDPNVQGKVVLTEGLLSPAKVKHFTDKGADGVIFISPGERIHEGTCTSIWGAPDLDNFDNEPTIPVLSISKPDGEELICLCEKESVKISFQTKLDKGWYQCPLIDVTIEGTEQSDEFVLLHGHLDSWHVGIGDNATGNAALMEMIRVFYKNRHQLKRSIRVVIWPGHSTGRYGGSTWFADNYALDLEENCIAQVNCDSPGCRWATSYKKMRWMSETEELCKSSIMDAIGKDSAGTRPTRAGDYSFNNIGLTSFYMLSSAIPDAVLKEKNYYTVGGCGSNIEWHTEDDLLHVADMDILMKDIKVYMTTILRVVNSTIYPFNFRTTVNEIIETINQYQEEAGSHFDLGSVLNEAQLLYREMEGFYNSIENCETMNVALADKINDIIRRFARELVLINYTAHGKFKHDPALENKPLPDISDVTELKSSLNDKHYYKVLLTHLTRGRNRVIWSLRKTRELLNGVEVN